MAMVPFIALIMPHVLSFLAWPSAIGQFPPQPLGIHG